MKELKKEELVKKNQVDHTKTERRILEKIKSPFIVSLKYAFQSRTKLYLVMDYCPGGELFFYLEKIGKFKEKTAKFYAACILLGLKELHTANIVYWDLKPENVLIGADGYARITDFGLSKENIQGNTEATSFCGTPEYLAPETLAWTGHGKAADWWSFGAIIYEMLFGIPPFYTKNRTKLYDNIRNKEVDIPEGGTAETADLIQKLLVKDPNFWLGSSEWDAEDIMEHPWFSSVNWEEL